MTTNLVQIFFPGLNSSDFTLMEAIHGTWPSGFLLTAYLLAWRAQITTILKNTLTTQAIQQLDTMKFIASQFNKIISIRLFIATIVITRTLKYEATTLSDLKDENARTSYLQELVNDLAHNKPPRGAKILNENQINKETIQSHRFGIMASIIGTFQATPLFEPGNIIKSSILSNLDFNTFIEIFVRSSDILMNNNQSSTIKTRTDLHNINNEKNGPKYHINQSITNGTHLEMQDNITLGSENNLFPLETTLQISRPTPVLPTEITLKPGENSLYLNLIANQNNPSQQPKPLPIEKSQNKPIKDTTKKKKKKK